MQPPEFAAPSPERITTVSPSLANDLLACQFKVAFGRDGQSQGWRRPSTYSVLGEAAHAVTEAAFKRSDWADDPAGRRSALEAAWEGCIAAGATKLSSAWSPAAPPPAEEWPGYQLTRTRTLRRAERLIAAKAPHRGDQPPGTGIETTLADPGSILQGRIDRVDRDGGVFRVVDLKTGLKQGAPTGDQTRQLLLYAVLVQRTTGEWPAEIAIENASGDQVAMPLDPAAAEAALRQVLAAVADFNQRIDDDSSFLDPRPGPETCRWCAYQVVCGPYWEEVRTEWNHRSLLGEITGSGSSDRGAFVDMRVASPSDPVSPTLHLSSIPQEPGAEATWIAAVDLRGAGDPKEMRAKWSSRIRAW
jgi:RecB family exonuclease